MDTNNKYYTLHKTCTHVHTHLMHIIYLYKFVLLLNKNKKKTQFELIINLLNKFAT